MPTKSLTARIRARIRRETKVIYWRIAQTHDRSQKLVFIVGCQRSGTSMLLEMFERDLRSRTYGEFSSITERNSIRLKPLSDVREEFCKSREPLIVCKPLVESQRTTELLDYFSGSKALWAYRHYQDVVNSNTKKFDSQVESCRIIIENEPANWRSEVVPEWSLELIRKHYKPNMSPCDAAALLWHARNSLYIEQNLAEHNAVRLWKYEEFVKYALQMMNEIYKWLNMTAPSPRIVDFVKSTSVGLGCGVKLSSEIDTACQALLDQLEKRYEATINTHT